MHLSRAIVPAIVPKLASLQKSAKRDCLGALHRRKAECSDQKVRVRIGLDTGFMALDSIYVYICIIIPYSKKLWRGKNLGEFGESQQFANFFSPIILFCNMGCAQKRKLRFNCFV